MKVMKASDDIVIKQFKKWMEDLNQFPNDELIRRDYNFVLSVLLERGYSERELTGVSNSRLSV